MTHLLARAGWDADAVRDDLLGDAAEHLGHPDGVPVVAETGFLTKGAMSVGGTRQYSGTAGRASDPSDAPSSASAHSSPGGSAAGESSRRRY